MSGPIKQPAVVEARTVVPWRDARLVQRIHGGHCHRKHQKHNSLSSRPPHYPRIVIQWISTTPAWMLDAKDAANRGLDGATRGPITAYAVTIALGSH
jgi:hypothetical protein